MNQIPPKIKDEIKPDPFYKRCCLEDADCAFEPGHKKIEWHHSIIFGGRQLQKKWAILPACSGFHHKHADRRDIKERFLVVAVNRATDVELRAVSKVINYFKWRKKKQA